MSGGGFRGELSESPYNGSTKKRLTARERLRRCILATCCFLATDAALQFGNIAVSRRVTVPEIGLNCDFWSEAHHENHKRQTAICRTSKRLTMITVTGITAVPVPVVLPKTEPAPSTPRERNQHLLDRIRDGDKAAATEMMEANMPLVHSSAWRLMEGYTGPEGRAREQALEELVERGMEGLCEGVHRIVKGNLKHDNVTGYLARWIEGAMYRPDDRLVSYLPEDRRVEQMKHEDWKRREKTEVPGPEEELMAR